MVGIDGLSFDEPGVGAMGGSAAADPMVHSLAVGVTMNVTMKRFFTPLAVVALPLLGGCTSVSGIDDYVFDGVGGGGAAHSGGGGSAGSSSGTGGAGGDGGDGGDGGEGGGSCPEQVIPFPATDLDHLVPAGVSFVHVKAWGGGGNQECDNDSGFGGVGGFTEAIFPVTPGAPLIVIVGRRKMSQPRTPTELVSFGFPGLGAGGLSGVFTGPAPLAANDQGRALIIAGGGGGAGALAENCNHGYPGNHPDFAGGQVGTMLGDNGNININSGGGGFEGGNGGTGDIDAGYGGSHHVATTALDSNVEYSTTGALSPPQVLDTDYADDAGKMEEPGRVVLRYSCSEPAL